MSQAGGYEVYVLELTDLSPEECHKRNTHNRSLADIQAAAAQWQETPLVYPLLDVDPLFGQKKKGKQVCCHSRHQSSNMLEAIL